MVLLEVINIHSILEKRSREVMGSLNRDGTMPAGHNGPYGDPETPVRNTAHWLVTFCHLFTQSGETKYREIGNRLTDYLLSQESRPMGASFYCRSNPEKDFCNGLVGQAWVMEGLIAAFGSLGREDAGKVAKDLFFLHPFLEGRAIWKRVAVDGSYLSPDETFNHQLWFAAIASLLDDEEIQRRVGSFLSRVVPRVQLYTNGVIFHQSRLNRSDLKNPKEMIASMRRLINWRRLYYKSVGYHGFNLYALALLRGRIPHHPFWNSKKMKMLLNAMNDRQFIKDLSAAALFGYWYNPSGIELAYSAEVFGMGEDLAQKWIDLQVHHSFNVKKMELLTLNSPDPITSAARIYECTRLTGQYKVRIDGKQ